MNYFTKQILLSFVAASPLFLISNSIAGEKVDAQLPVTSATTVSIENLSGKVRVIGWQKDQVSVKGELADNAEKLIFEQSGNTINVKVELPKNSYNDWHEKGSELTVYMPSTLRMNFEGISSDIALEKLSHSVTVKTVSGDIKANNISENVELSSVSGDIESHDLQGKINLSVVSGNISDKSSSGRLQLQAVSGEVESISTANEVNANNVSGDIELKLSHVDELHLATISGESKVNLVLNENGILKASSISGEITIAFQENVAADFHLKANAGGDLINKLTSDKAKDDKYGPSSKLYFQTGNANGSVRVSTVSGEVTVK